MNNAVDKPHPHSGMGTCYCLLVRLRVQGKRGDQDALIIIADIYVRTRMIPDNLYLTIVTKLLALPCSCNLM